MLIQCDCICYVDHSVCVFETMKPVYSIHLSIRFNTMFVCVIVWNIIPRVYLRSKRTKYRGFQKKSSVSFSKKYFFEMQFLCSTKKSTKRKIHTHRQFLLVLNCELFAMLERYAKWHNYFECWENLITLTVLQFSWSGIITQFLVFAANVLFTF